MEIFFPCELHVGTTCLEVNPNDITKWCKECGWHEEYNRETRKAKEAQRCGNKTERGCRANYANMSMWCKFCLGEYQQLRQAEAKRRSEEAQRKARPL